MDVNNDDNDDDGSGGSGGTQGDGCRDSDDEDDLMMYPEGLDLSSFDQARGTHASGYCDEFDSGDD